MAGSTVLAALLLLLVCVLGEGNPEFGKLTEELHGLVEDKKLATQREDHMQIWLKAQNAVPFDKRKLGVTGFSCLSGNGNSTEAPVYASPTTPTSVHALRPGDIKVVAALGDSITAANGAGAQGLLGVLLEYRGISWDIGGDGDLAQMATIPNILREFNPAVTGFSTGVGPVWLQSSSHLNVAVPGAKAKDLKSQAKQLVQRLRSDPNVDFENDWKLVSLFIGGNDLCQYCQNFQNRFGSRPQKYARDIKKALDELYNNLPRTLVNIVSVVHVELLRQTHKSSLFCVLTHSLECPCIVNNRFSSRQMDDLVRSYQNLTRGFEASGFYDLRDDFSLVVQPFLEDAHLPFLQGGQNVDLAFFAPDCFHWSQIGHSVTARGLWNSMLQPVGNKSRDFNPNVLNRLECPDPACPFIRTTKNSLNCSAYLPTTTTTTSTTATTTEAEASTEGHATTTPEAPPTPPEATTEGPEKASTEEPTTEEPIVTHRPIRTRKPRTRQPKVTTPPPSGNETAVEMDQAESLLVAMDARENGVDEAEHRSNVGYTSSIILGECDILVGLKGHLRISGLLVVLVAGLLGMVMYKKKWLRFRRVQDEFVHIGGDYIKGSPEVTRRDTPVSEKTPLLLADNSNVKIY